MTLAIIGGGNLGEALLSGLSRSEGPDGIQVVEKDPDRVRALRSRFDIQSVHIGQLTDADTIVIAVKPHHVDGLVAELAEYVTDAQLIVSAAGGITTAQVERGLGTKSPVVRCMPNTPVSVGAGIIAISPGAYADAGHLERVRSLLAPLGRVVEVPEYQLDAVTALSGSGPAYFCLLAEAMIDAGVLAGLSRPLATELVTHTAAGAGLLLRDSGADPVALRAAVSSPGGMTIAAIRELESRAIRAAMMAAVEAARNRSVELGRQGAQS